jgi:hypothetical protein
MGSRDGAGRNRRIATGLKTGRPMLGELDVTRVLREFTTNYTFERRRSLGFVVLW